MVSWNSRHQTLITLSNCEAEYIAACEASQELVWLCKLLASIGYCQPIATPLLCDNNSAITVSSNPIFHAKLKHTLVKYKYVHKRVDDGQLYLHCVSSKDNVTDAFTNTLTC
jgi:hypothetical protein